YEEETVHNVHIPGDAIMAPTTMCTAPPRGSEDRAVTTGDSPQLLGAQVSSTIRKSPIGPRSDAGAGASEGTVLIPPRSKRTKSCPPGA
ncbi:hypothetical protein A2U01_0082525, partial [Trifolium medium]|nr:hypothetical protein [Trifolium medium]